MDAKFKNQRLLVSRHQPTSDSNRIFELKSCLKSLTKLESKDSGSKLIDTIINYIDAILNESTTKSIREQIKFCGHLEIIKCCVMPYNETIFVKNFVKRIFDILLEEDGNIWYVKRELVKIFLICIRRVPKEVRKKAINTLPDFYLYKLIDSISSYGDYDFQVAMVELVFCVYGKNTILGKWKDLIPESQELNQTFSSISSSTFDEDVRKFLNELNEKSSKIFSIFCHDVFLGNVHCGETFENSNGIWVDFNLSGGAVSWYVTTEYFLEDKASPSDPPWTMATFFVPDVDFVQVFRPPNTRNTVIHVKLKMPCVSSYDSCGTKVAEASDVKFFVSKDSGKTTALITRILPGMFKHKFHHNGPALAQATKKVYKPLNLSIVRQSKLNTSRVKSDASSFTGRVAPIPAGFRVSSATSPSSNAASEVISISDSSVHSSIDLLTVGSNPNPSQYETAQRPPDDGAEGILQIISGRCTKISLSKKTRSEDSSVFETAQGPQNTETELYETANLSLRVNLGHHWREQGISDLDNGPAGCREKEIHLEDILQFPDYGETFVTPPSSPSTKEESENGQKPRETAPSDLEREPVGTEGCIEGFTLHNILDHINKAAENAVENEMSSYKHLDQECKQGEEEEEEAVSVAENSPKQTLAGHTEELPCELELDLDSEPASRERNKEIGRETFKAVKNPQEENISKGEKEKKSLEESEPKPPKSGLDGSSAALEKKQQRKVLEENSTKCQELNTNRNEIVSSNDNVDLILKENVPIRDKAKKTAAVPSQENLPDVNDNTITRPLRKRAVQIPKRANRRPNKKKTNKPKASKEEKQRNEQNSKDRGQKVVDTFSPTQNQDSLDEVIIISEDSSAKPSNQESLPVAVAERAVPEEEITVVVKENDVGVKKPKHLSKIHNSESEFDGITLLWEGNTPGASNDDESAPAESRVLETETAGKKQEPPCKIHKDQIDFDEITSICEDNAPGGSNMDSEPAANESKVLETEITTISEEKQTLLSKIRKVQTSFDEIILCCEDNPPRGSNKDNEPATKESVVLEVETTAIAGKKRRKPRKIRKDQSSFDKTTLICEEGLNPTIIREKQKHSHNIRRHQIDDNLPGGSNKNNQPAANDSKETTTIIGEKLNTSLKICRDQSNYDEITSICEDNPLGGSNKDDKLATNELMVLEPETTAVAGKKQKLSRKIRKDQSSLDDTTSICKDNLLAGSNREDEPVTNKLRVLEVETTTIPGAKQKKTRKICEDQSNFDKITSISEDNPLGGSNKDDKPAINESRVLQAETTAIIGEKHKIHKTQSNVDEITSICKDKHPEGSNKDDQSAADKSPVLETEISEGKQKHSHKTYKDQSSFDEITSICRGNPPGGSNKDDEQVANESAVLGSRTTESSAGKQPNETVDEVKQTESKYRKKKEYSLLMGFLKDPSLINIKKHKKKTKKNQAKEERRDLSMGSDQEALPPEEVRRVSEIEKSIRNCVVLLRKHEVPEELSDKDSVEPISSNKTDTVPKATQKSNKLLSDETDGLDKELLEASVCEVLFDQLKKEEGMKTEAANVERDELVSEKGYSEQTVVHTCAMVHQCDTQKQNDVTETLTEGNKTKSAQSFNKPDKLEEIAEHVQRVEDEGDNQMLSTTLGSRKRRKLYDPSDLTYLDNITVLEEAAKPEESKGISALNEDVVPVIAAKKKTKQKRAQKESYSKKSRQETDKTENKRKKTKKLKILRPDTILTSFWHETLQSYKKGTSTSLQETKNSSPYQDSVKKKPSRQQTRSKNTKRPARKTRAAFSKDRIVRDNLSSDMSEASLKLPKTTGEAQEPDFVASDEQAVPDMQLVRKINIISDIQIRPKRVHMGADSGIPRKKSKIDEGSGSAGENVPVRNITNEEIFQWIETGSPNYSQTIIERQIVLKNCYILLKTLVNQPDDSMEYRDVVAVSEILKKYV